MKSHQFSLSFPPSTFAQLRSIASKHKRSIGYVVREIVIHLLNNPEQIEEILNNKKEGET